MATPSSNQGRARTLHVASGVASRRVTCDRQSMRQDKSLISRSDPTRDLAFDILTGIFEHRRMLETTMDRSSIKAGRDRASAHRLAATVLRHYGSMTELLRPLLKKEPPVPVLCALLMGVAQLRYLETPPHAAVSTVVALLRRRRLTPFAGLANAVLRRVAREGAELEAGLDHERLDIPPWLWSAWGDQARAIAAGLYQEAPLDIRLKPGIAPATVLSAGRDMPLETSGDMKDSARDDLPRVAPRLLPNGSARYPAGTRVTLLDGFKEGQLWVQDAAAAMPVLLMGAVEGKNVIDLCAAPGGKTAQLASQGAHVTAVERDATRMRFLKENMKRLDLKVTCVQADALTWRPTDKADMVLLDAPCSATGTFRRHPDVLWVKRPRDIFSLTQQQDRLIDAAHEMLPPGGTMIYAVCSLQDEEGPGRVHAACARGWALHPFTEGEAGAMSFALTASGCFRTHPGMWPEEGGLDGFFVARLKRI